MSDGQAAAENLNLLGNKVMPKASIKWAGNKEELDNLLKAVNSPHKISTTNQDLILLNNAMMGSRGADQTRIARLGLKWIATVLRKNHDYGGSVWKKPRLAPHLNTGDSILVRLGDKIERLETLIAKNKNEVTDES